MTTVASNTPQPFGTDLVAAADDDDEDILVVSEGNNGVPGRSAASSYRLSEDGELTAVSVSTGEADDPLITGFTFGCWIEIAQGPDGDFAFVANTPDGTLTSYSLADDGALAVLESEAGDAGIDGDDTQNGGGVLDTEVTWPFLYQVVNNDSRIAQWEIQSDGSLVRQESVEIVDARLRARQWVGIAGF